ncbi:hypothetical protein H4R18_005210 [Coemansia javaensis]|uniref:BZIP domain-containing protein n=1 Tax=Coemansia javaensis TaxID=2761396 RepID=A0A9W8LFQ5_9FUNG|nr:hypothetical protein H4R18_005210 [Coemansia javaensis]
MSPLSRRRYRSRMSSARLRERQRQRVVDAENAVAWLEARVEQLQSQIDQKRQLQRSDPLQGEQGQQQEHEHQGAAGEGDPEDFRDRIQGLAAGINRMAGHAAACARLMAELRATASALVLRPAAAAQPPDGSREPPSRHSISYIVDLE